jgi:hypothetical protein
MAGARGKWIERGGIGCLVLLGGVAVLLGSAWLVMMNLTNEAVKTRRSLDAALPSQETYTPPADGSIPPQRLERFLAVRRALMPYCETFSRHRTAFSRMETLEESEEEPPAGEFLGSLGAVSKSLWQVGRDVGEYAIARNRILLENGMGLGEYTWIYVITYFAWLENTPRDLLVQSDSTAKIFHGRVRDEIVGMMQRHVAARDAKLRSREGSASSLGKKGLALWRAELESLDRDPMRVPFQDGLPPEIEASLEPFRRDLERLFCPATGELEIMRRERVGIWYDHR